MGESRPVRQELQHAGLINLIANRPHMVTIWNVQHLRARDDFA
jgi:hypothetical protein